ncbi:MAG: permease prefix domain 1-containing protein [Cellulomonas sp.]|uniref:permease prefix domain 1-containing protein n=1 Tax=Cellulomonas sp. TaxID=40001 RepID=UPI002589E5DB|nr:permease prefix domain 1-containing protein [Cellulomonas sp.]MCR6705367.1 permease prefix domain 1-containing protein [Cellulomonas sp.]
MSTVHRLLDDAFAGVDLTPEVQDLKEEIRSNLEARALELQLAGVSPDEAPRRAFDELGDVRALVADAAGAAPVTVGSPDGARPQVTAVQRAAQAARLQKVRPRPGFVVGVVLASLVGAGALVVATLGALGTVDVADAALLAALVVAAAAVGWLTGASLAQETTTNHPLPARRAAGYGLGAGLTVGGAALAGATALRPLATGWYVPAGLLLVVGVCLLSALGATQTNRKKAWARDAEQAYVADNRFEQDPAAAARFGIYTAALWTVAAAVFLAVGFAGGWAWAWLVLVAASGPWLLMLARMLFGAGTGDRRA